MCWLDLCLHGVKTEAEEFSGYADILFWLNYFSNSMSAVAFVLSGCCDVTVT